MSRLSRAVAAAEKIPGWMEVDELEWLGEQASEVRWIAEVGSYYGRSTKVLALMTPGFVVSIDDLTGEVDHASGQSVDKTFQRNLRAHIASNRVRPVRLSSPAATKYFPSRFFDFVFIDGDHVAPAPLKDIKAWRPMVKREGVLAGHDRLHHGVHVALDELDITGAGPGSIWVDG